MKILLRVLSGLALVLVIVVVVLVFWGGHVVKHTVELVGPQVLGVPVKVEQARFHPLRGYISISGLVVDNPEGFRTENLFNMRNLEVDVDMRSLFSDPLIINRIIIDNPVITYEMGLRRTNLGVLLEGLESQVEKEEAEELPVEDDVVPRQVIIKEFVLADATARISATALRGGSVPIQLGTIRLTELGGEDQSTTEIITQITRAILGTVVNGVANAGSLLGDGLMSAFDGVGALGGMAVDGARAVGGGIATGARAVRDRVTGGGEDVEVELEEAVEEESPRRLLRRAADEETDEILEEDVDEEARSGRLFRRGDRDEEADEVLEDVSEDAEESSRRFLRRDAEPEVEDVLEEDATEERRSGLDRVLRRGDRDEGNDEEAANDE